MLLLKETVKIVKCQIIQGHCGSGVKPDPSKVSTESFEERGTHISRNEEPNFHCYGMKSGTEYGVHTSYAHSMAFLGLDCRLFSCICPRKCRSHSSTLEVAYENHQSLAINALLSDPISHVQSLSCLDSTCQAPKLPLGRLATGIDTKEQGISTNHCHQFAPLASGDTGYF